MDDSALARYPHQFSGGQVIEYGPAVRVFGDPQHACTRALFAAAPGRGYSFGG